MFWGNFLVCRVLLCWFRLYWLCWYDNVRNSGNSDPATHHIRVQLVGGAVNVKNAGWYLNVWELSYKIQFPMNKEFNCQIVRLGWREIFVSKGNLSGSQRWQWDQLCSSKHCSVLIMSQGELCEKYTESNLFRHQVVKHLRWRQRFVLLCCKL